MILIENEISAHLKSNTIHVLNKTIFIEFVTFDTIKVPCYVINIVFVYNITG